MKTGYVDRLLTRSPSYTTAAVCMVYVQFIQKWVYVRKSTS